MPRVDRIGDCLADQVGADRPAPQAVALEQVAVSLDVTGVGQRPIDLEVVSPARELDAVEAPPSGAGGEVGERQVGPLAGEEGDRSRHFGSLADVG